MFNILLQHLLPPELCNYMPTCYINAVIGNVIVNETGYVHIADSEFSGGGCGGNWGGSECTTSPGHEGHVEEEERREDQGIAAVRQAVWDWELQGNVSRREF